MPDSNHWDSLLSDIGAIPPSEDKLRQPEPKEPSPAKQEKPAAAHRSPPPKTADWDNVANALGLEPSPKAVEPPRAEVAKPVAPKRPRPTSVVPRRGVEPHQAEVEKPAAPERPRPTSVTPERGEESPNFFDERFDFEEPFDLLESTDETTDEPKPVADEPTEKRPRRRRRRRHPAKDSDARKAESPTDDDVDNSASKPKPFAEGISIQRDEEVETKDADKPRSEQGDENRRSKRRRPRRGRKRTSNDESKSEDARTKTAESEEELNEPFDEDDLDVGHARKGTDEGSVRAGFRGIPTWDEAIGLLVEKNLESRSKRPEGGSQRGRGRKRRS